MSRSSLNRRVLLSCCAALLSLGAGRVLAQQRDKLESIINEAARQIESHNFQAASALLKRSLDRHPNDASLWNLLGISETELDHKAAAGDAFRRGLRLDPDSISLNENAGLLYYREADYAGAKHYLSKALALGGKNPGVAFSLAAAKIRTGESREGLADLQRLEADLAGFPDYWDERGWAEIAKDPAAAESHFARALALAPDDLRALNGAASVAELQKLDEKALSFLLRAKQAHPDDVETLVHFGTVCLRRDLTLDALPALERAYKLAPANNSALFFFARAQIGVRHWQEAYDLFTGFVRRIPNFAPAYYALGWLDIKLNRTAQARQHLEKCLSLAPGHDDARYELAQLDLDAGNIDSAEKMLREVLERDPKHAKANIAYGDILLRKGNLAEARYRYEIAIQADPASGAAHYKLSTVLFRLKRSDEAEKERALGARLNAEALKSSKVVLQLASPDGAILSAVK